ncbi:MAG: 16S rRNA (cytidine(1402)-2'-O)-methyltransferase [Peptococcaceae bacterium]|nr:16S rRNA (cytidine(1402)-2'-O)-methyltransferase [Peptococcaceae bacterium]
MIEKGTLYLCATPIGNLEDITLRALRVLKEVDLVAAEDTRRTRKLFSRYDIHTPLTSYHEHNSRSKGPYLIGQLLAGKSVALVTDAGLPGVSDPGEKLTALAVSEGIRVVPVPGPSASLAALAASGLPTERFCFEGFLPARGPKRRQRLEELKPEKRTLILYEAPHRLAATLADLAGVLGDRRICLARELTKQYEEIWRGSLAEAVSRFRDKPPRGEITLVLEGSPAVSENRSFGGTDLRAMVADLERGGMSRKEAIREASRRSGVSRREVYSSLLEKKQEGL